MLIVGNYTYAHTTMHNTHMHAWTHILRDNSWVSPQRFEAIFPEATSLGGESQDN